MKNKFHVILLFILCSFALNAQDTLYEEIAGSVTFVVAQNGSGDFDNVQDAAVAVRTGAIENAVIYVKNGVYEEELFITRTANLTIVGQNADSVIITALPTHGDEGFGSATARIAGEGFSGFNLTIENSYGGGNQAEALAASNDRQQYVHCRFIGFQDTYYSGGKRQYFKDCLFIGAVDYIFGNSTAIFDSCQIHNLRDRSWITAASTLQNQRFGYVFRDCWVTGKYGVKDVYFGRPWKDYPKVLFMNCYLSDIMSPLGWDNTWHPDISTVSFFEYNNFGPGSDISGRIDYSRQLTEEEASAYVLDTIFDPSHSSTFSSEWSPDLEESFIYKAVKKHVKPYLDKAVTKAKLRGLKLNGEDIAGFDPEGEEVNITLPSGSTDWPVLEPIPESADMKTEIMYPAKIPASATVVVSSKYEAMHKVYTVNFKHDQTLVFEVSDEIPPIFLNQNIGDCITNVADNLENASLAIYPNPSKGIFTMNIRNYEYNDPVTVQIYSLMGQKIYSESYMPEEIKMDNRIDLSNFPDGQYLVNVYSANKDYSAKIILK